MRHLAWTLAGALALVGCGGGGSESPVQPSAPSGGATGPIPAGSAMPTATTAALGGVVVNGDIANQALGIYTFSVDPSTLTASITPKEVRQAQGNDDLTDLDVSCFLAAGSVALVDLQVNGANLDLTYTFKHPFPDSGFHTLGAPVRAVILADADVSEPTFFVGDGDIKVNTSLVANADGYIGTGATLDLTGYTANAFPYYALVDEVLDNRDVTNGALVQGNWTAPNGWQTGTSGTWTGFGWLHKGQTATRTISLDLAALAGPNTFDVAFIAKYAKPNSGGTTKSPSAPANVLEFGYRAYHGALDIEKLTFVSEDGGFIANAISFCNMAFSVRDWDANAVETAELDLQDEVDASMVGIGESGPPTLEVSIPDVLGATPAAIGTVGPESGEAGDEISYTASVPKAAGGLFGTLLGLARATDPEALVDTTAYHFAIDCATFTPGPIIEPIVYQLFTVDVDSGDAVPTATLGFAAGAGLILSGDTSTVNITGITDAEAQPLDIDIDWDNGGGFVPVVAGLASPYPNQNAVSPAMINTDLIPDAKTISVRLDDGVNTTTITLPALLGANRAPVPSGAPVLAAASISAGGSFTLNAGTANAVDPEGDAVTYFVTTSATPTGPFPNIAGLSALPIPGIGPYTSAGAVNITLHARDPLHGNATASQPDSTSTFASVAGGVETGGWVYTALVSPAGTEIAYAVATANDGSVFTAGTFSASGVNFGGGLRNLVGTSPDIFILKLNSDGTYAWDKQIGVTGTSPFKWIKSVQSDNSGNVYIYGVWSGILGLSSLGGGAINETSNAGINSTYTDIFVIKLDPTGNFLDSYRTNDTGMYQYSYWGPGPGSWAGPGATPGSQSMAINRNNNNLVLCTAGLATGGATLNSGLGLINGTGTTLTYDHVLIALDSGLNPIWANLNGTTTSTGASEVASAVYDSAGDVYIGGTFSGTKTFVGTSQSGNPNAILVKRNGATGAGIWDRNIVPTVGGPSEDVTGIATDGTRVYITGRLYAGSGITHNFGLGGLAEPLGATGHRPYIAAFNCGTGTNVWARYFTQMSSSTSWGRDIWVTGGSVFTSGNYSANLNFGGGLRTSTSGSVDMYLTRLDAVSGVWTYDKQIGGTGTDQMWGAVPQDPATGSPIIVGQYSTANCDFDPGIGTALRTATGGSADMFVVKLRGSSGEF